MSRQLIYISRLSQRLYMSRFEVDGFNMAGFQPTAVGSKPAHVGAVGFKSAMSSHRLKAIGSKSAHIGAVGFKLTQSSRRLDQLQLSKILSDSNSAHILHADKIFLLI